LWYNAPALVADGVAEWSGVSMTEWASIRRQICEARRFSEGPEGLRLLSDVIMPSGGLVWVTIQPRGSGFSAHDSGAAFEELARHAAEIGDLRGVRRMLAETNFRLTDDGVIWADNFDHSNVFEAASFVSDASLRAAHYLLDRALVPVGARLDSRVKDALRLRYPDGRPDFMIQGLNRQHTFDFGVTIEGETILVQSVTPDHASISAAIVKGLDASKTPRSRVKSIFVYDSNDDWGSDRLNMLELAGASAIDFSRLAQVDAPLSLH
jgi:hypothetical protein